MFFLDFINIHINNVYPLKLSKKYLNYGKAYERKTKLLIRFFMTLSISNPIDESSVITFTCNLKKGNLCRTKGRREKLTETSLNNLAIRGNIKSA